jgi:hypothetical protein
MDWFLFCVEFAEESFIGRSWSDASAQVSRRRLASEADLLHVAKVGAATAAEHIEMAELASQIGVLTRKLRRIPDVEARHGFEFGVAAHRGIGANSPQSLDPRLAGKERAFKMRRDVRN